MEKVTVNVIAYSLRCGLAMRWYCWAGKAERRDQQLTKSREWIGSINYEVVTAASATKRRAAQV